MQIAGPWAPCKRVPLFKTAQYTLLLTFMLPCIVIDLFLNNQPDALIIQILFSYKTLTCFGQPLCPPSGILYCTFGNGKFHAGC